MCGIFGLLSAHDVANPPGEELFRELDALLYGSRTESLSTVLSQWSGGQRLLDQLDAVRAEAARWTGRAACVAIARNGDLAARLRAAVERLREWVSGLERLTVAGRTALEERQEVLNRLVVGGKDLAWQIERDVLENASAVAVLAGVLEPRILARAWELSLALRSLDRLEVRGRDSAGIAIYARFPDAEELESFLDGPDGSGARRQELRSREDFRLLDGAVLRPGGEGGAGAVLLFAFKVASEVGKMGDNVAYLRGRIASEPFFQSVLREPGVELQLLAHTRWASNGVISLANCHPVDCTVCRDGAASREGAGRLVAVLNGDIDNYRALVDKYVKSQGLEIDPAITTDAKIIPIVVAHHFERCRSLEESFRRTFDEFEGSMAIGLMAADCPGELYFAQKGSGQGLFFGAGDETIAVASELYGVVELTPSFVKAERECGERGEVFRVRACAKGVELQVLDPARGGFVEVGAERKRQAEITTRDINRAGFAHFFLKEITESAESVEKTIRGRFAVGEAGDVRARLGPETIPLALVTGLREGQVRHIAVIGQGTAAVAAQGIAHLLARALRGLPHPVTVAAQKSSELSAHHLRDSMSDTLVVAVSQSGTTTDTNRTVDLARQRGAWVLAIVNRRNSDLAFKSHAVLFTSDGRDIEMSVASTKAFYAQIVAGQVLALGLADALGTLGREELRSGVEELFEVPALLRRTLALEDTIADLARRLALRRRHWAVVGSGASKVAADEIRIKLSELCYKSIAVDFLEDKKHIDLSSEPLVIVCAAGLPSEVTSDAVKEVAIFKAHSAIPVVIAEEGQSGFEPYAAGMVVVPRSRGALGFLPAVMAGHLFGYHAAAAMDAVADRLRRLRARVVNLGEEMGRGEESAAAALEALSSTEAPALVELAELLESGALDGGLEVHTAVRLAKVLELSLGRISVDGFAWQRCSANGVLETVVRTLSDAVVELSRPIDAIKHQAKTVTVGISRGEAVVAEGRLRAVLRELGVAQEDLLESHRGFVAAFEPLVAEVEGATLYRVSRLDPLGRPLPESRIVVARKLGCARQIESRSETEQPLAGNKWAVLKLRDVFLGFGQADGRRILIVPAVGERVEGYLVLFHVALVERGEREQRLRALAARGNFFDRLKGAVTECNLEWEPALIDAVDNDKLFLGTPESVAEELARARVRV
jgi:glucosamine--fructose-6-phosphate aminotransferase (isomerizing)